MAADQATRLRDAVLDAVGDAYGGALTIAGIHGFRYTGEVSPDNWPVPLEAALDTLIQYHRQAGAVEALGEAVDRFCPPGSALRETCGQQTVIAGKPAQRAVCGSHLMLAAAQARLALLEQERPAYEEERGA